MVVLSGGKAEQARELTPRTAAQLDAAGISSPPMRAHVIQPLEHGTVVARTWTAFWCRDPCSAQRVGDRVGQGRGRPSDQAPQVTGAGAELAAARAKAGAGEDFRQLARSANSNP